MVSPASDENDQRPRVLVTGVTGYIGGRLMERFHRQGVRVRCVTRDLGRFDRSRWPDVEVIQGDLADVDTAQRALEGIDVAYYLVHSMASGQAFVERDREIAQIFATAARLANVSRIIYLGGLGDSAEVLSEHLNSRHEVGRLLATTGVPVVEFRAAMIVGSGSVSFEMLRCLTERVPIMITPQWVSHRCQPIGVRNVLEYLLEALDHPDAEGIYEIGGSDVLSYQQMMLEYANLRGLRRWIYTPQVPHPEWSARFIDLVTPIPYAIAQPLVAGLHTDMVVRDDRALREFSVRPMGYRAAVELALTRMAGDEIETTWASSMASSGGNEFPGRQLSIHEGMLTDSYQFSCSAPPDAVFEAACALGGDAGWPSGNVLWQIRGMMDRAVGGVGMRRGRRHPRQLRVGEPLDFWRVEALEPSHLLRLRAEMKLPGTAWLQFKISPEGVGSRVDQTAFFDPRGLFGYLYWYVFLPFHRFLFPGLIRAVCRSAELDVAKAPAT